MKAFKTLFIAAALVGAPGLALAQGCDYLKERQATMTCAPGTILDSTTGTCLAEATS